MNGPASLADFRARFPEFASADDSLVQSFLDAAIARLAPSGTSKVWDTLLSEGHLYLSAELLSRAPNGQMARLSSDKGESTYSVDFKRLQAQVTCLLRAF